jgi:hypothetical protein
MALVIRKRPPLATEVSKVLVVDPKGNTLAPQLEPIFLLR